MARLLTHLLAHCLFIGFGTAASAQWTQTAGPVGADFVTVAALSESEVLAATRSGSVYAYAEGWEWRPGATLPARIYRHGDIWYYLDDGVFASADHGLTWKNTEFPGEVHAAFAATDAFYAATEETVYVLTGEAGEQEWSVFIPSLVIEVPVGSSTTTGLLRLHEFFVHEGLFLANGHVNGHVGIFRSEDGGQTWTRVFPAPPPNDFFPWEGVIYGYGCHSSRSLDGGLTWEYLEQPTVDGSAACFDYLAGVGDVLLAQGTINGVGRRSGIFRLEGDTWVRVHLTASSLSASGDVVFAADEGGAYRSDDGGTTWTMLPMDLVATTTVPYSLGGERALAVTAQGFLHRSDDDVSWSDPATIDAEGLRASALLVHPEAVLAATEDGIFRSVDGGLTWVESNTGIDYHPFHLDKTPRLATDGEVVVAGFSYGFAQQGHGGTSFGGLQRSTDGGQSWSSMNETFPLDDEGRPLRVGTVAMNDAAIVVYTFEGVFTSADEGASWTPASGLPTGLAGFIRSLYAFGDTFYAITTAGQLFESTDGGLIWFHRPDGVPPTQSFHDAHLFSLDGQTYLVVNKDGNAVVYRRGPEAWEPVALETPPGVRFNGFAPHGDLVLAGTVDAGVWTVPAEAFTPAVANEAAPAPAYTLSAIHPNPTAGASRLTLTLAAAQPVRVEVLDVLGRRVALLHEGHLPAGAHTLAIPTETLGAGTYLARITGADFADVRRVTVVR